VSLQLLQLFTTFFFFLGGTFREAVKAVKQLSFSFTAIYP